jgi:hypothetical protein
MLQRISPIAFTAFSIVLIFSAMGRTAAPAPAEIVVVGTVHAATAKYSVHDLELILQRIKPDVILYEYPADMMTPEFEFKSVLKNSLEQQAVIEYVKRSGAKIRPYDIDGRNAFYERTNFFALQRQYNKELNAQIDKKGLGVEAQKIVDSLDAADARRDAIGQSDPLTINSFQADAAINDKQWLMNQGIPEIVRLTPGLKSGEVFWNASRAYWIRRNNEMVRNIKRLAAEFAGKRLVVLCGFEHRYYLRSHLYDWDEQPGYIVKEYWEYERSSGELGQGNSEAAIASRGRL